jgi:molybdopterin synthase sulfur carrier subunit
MKLELRFFANYREAVGQKTIEREYPEDYDVGDLLRDLEGEYDDLVGELIEDGRVRSQVNILLNGRNVLHEDGLRTALGDGDTVSVFPPVAGG